MTSEALRDTWADFHAALAAGRIGKLRWLTRLRWAIIGPSHPERAAWEQFDVGRRAAAHRAGTVEAFERYARTCAPPWDRHPRHP